MMVEGDAVYLFYVERNSNYKHPGFLYTVATSKDEGLTQLALDIQRMITNPGTIESIVFQKMRIVKIKDGGFADLESLEKSKKIPFWKFKKSIHWIAAAIWRIQ